MTRAVVKSITGYTGDNPPRDVIDLKIDKDTVHAGSDVTGTVRLLGDNTIRKIHLVCEGLEYCVVALPQSADYSTMAMDYLKKHTSEKHVLTRQEFTYTPNRKNRALVFRFGLPDDLPGTLRCVLDGTDPTLPSQCQIKYTVTASIYNDGNTSSTQVSHPIIVLPKKESELPLDPSVSVSVASSMDGMFKSFFSCGSLSSKEEHPKSWAQSIFTMSDEPSTMAAKKKETHILLESSHDKLRLAAGQSLQVQPQDWFGRLTNSKNVWMIKLTEDLRWTSKGRTAHNFQSWDLFANHHELPTTLRRSYNDAPHPEVVVSTTAVLEGVVVATDNHVVPQTRSSQRKSLLSVRHEIVVYWTTKDPSKEILATTEPISVQIVMNNGGCWDA
jgi:hypothetical protein